MTTKRTCPCGSGRQYPACCEPLHDGVERAETAEQVMRSRFSAFALALRDPLLRSWHPRTRPHQLDVDPDLEFVRLEILDVVDGGPDDSEGIVEFAAHWRLGQQTGVQRERSRFVRRAGRWMYVDAVGESSE